MRKVRTAREHRQVRHRRIRYRASGTGERPRLAVFRSLNHIYAQIIDDTQQHTIAAASSLEAEVRGQQAGKTKTQVAREVGALLARRSKGLGISRVVFDRGGFRYHGRVQALANAAREEGLNF